MKTVPLTAFPRTSAGRSGVKKLRTSGRVPAVIYGREIKPQNLEINRKEIEDLIHGAASENLLVDLAVNGDARAKRLALLQEIQHHALTQTILHVDLHEVSETELVTVMVPVETTGEASGVKNSGGVLERILHKVKVRALPKDLPEAIVIDVTILEIGRAVHIGEIVPPPGVEVLGDKHIPVVACAAPITEEQETAAVEAAAGAGEVEMIKEKKEDGTEGEAKPAAAAAKGEKGAAPAKGAEKGAAPAKGAEKAAPAAEKKK